MSAYITPAQADEIIGLALLSNDSRRCAWATLSPNDRNILLNQASVAIDTLYLSGRKADPLQENAFPRHGQDQVPKAILDACALEACARSLGTSEADKRAALQAQGVTSFSVGRLSESYDSSLVPAPGDVRSLCSREAQILLKPYLLGGVEIV